MRDSKPPSCRRLLAWACATIPIAGCFSAVSYSAPNGARLATTTRLTPETQQGRWACAGWDLVLANHALYELNAGYEITNVERIDGAAVFHYKVEDLATMFVIPDDRTLPARIEIRGSLTVARSNIQGTTAKTVEAGSDCPPAPPVTVW
jgi:hypothetical protein